MDSTTSTTVDPNRIINHAIEGGLKADEPWLIVLGFALVLLIVVLVWIGVRRRKRSLLSRCLGPGRILQRERFHRRAYEVLADGSRQARASDALHGGAELDRAMVRSIGSALVARVGL